MAEMIEVQPEHTLPDLLALIAARHAADPNQPVILAVPSGIALLRQMESYQAFKEATKRSDLQLKILSSDARVVGLALVFGIDAERVAPPSGSAPGTRPLVAPPALPPVAPPTLPPVASPILPPRVAAPSPLVFPTESPVALAPPAAPLAPATALPAEEQLSETDWLFGGEVDLDYILRDADAFDTRSATPPPDVALLGNLPPGVGQPSAPLLPPDVALPGNLPPVPAQSSAPPPPVVPLESAVIADSPEPSDDLSWLTAGVDFAALTGGSLNPHAVPAAATDSPFQAYIAPDRDPPPEPPALPLALATLDLADDFGDIAAFDPFAPELGTFAPFVPEGDASPPAGGGPLSSLLLGGNDEEDAPAMSFSEWLALQKSSVAERTDVAASSDVDLSNLPSWLRPQPAAAALPTPPAPVAAAPSPALPTAPVALPVSPFAPKGTLRCPHCGEALDPEEMLRLLAQVWGT